MPDSDRLATQSEILAPWWLGVIHELPPVAYYCGLDFQWVGWTIPWSPGISVNHIYTSRGSRGQRRMTDEASAWKDVAIAQVRGSLPSAPIPMAIISGCPLETAIVIFPPDKRKRDIDNLVKLPQDAVCAALGIDDRRITRSHVYLAPATRTHPGILFAIRALAPDSKTRAKPAPKPLDIARAIA